MQAVMQADNRDSRWMQRALETYATEADSIVAGRLITQTPRK